jgi:hypothetical protein
MFFAIAYGRPEQRGVWFILACALLIVGLVRRKRASRTDGLSGT